jgi:hypothetical protein
MIYSQRYLMDQGVAVTWDNPDIRLERGGAIVPSNALQPGTGYDVVARIWNASIDAPAVNLPVTFSYLVFGIGTVSLPIGRTSVDLPVRGAPGCPVDARMRWTTPTTPGHYCLQVELKWADDANPANNLGQENIDVRPLNSPHASFTFPVRNDGLATRGLRLEADAYRVPPRPRCDPEDKAPSPRLTREERARRRRETLARHGRATFPVPDDWRVEISPTELSLEPGEEREASVDITAPDGFTGRQAFNVNAFDGSTLVGGVTLEVEASR